MEERVVETPGFVPPAHKFSTYIAVAMRQIWETHDTESTRVVLDFNDQSLQILQTRSGQPGGHTTMRFSRHNMGVAFKPSIASTEFGTLTIDQGDTTTTISPVTAAFSDVVKCFAFTDTPFEQFVKT